MAETPSSDKPGFLSRLFGRKPDPAAAPSTAPTPADLPRAPNASTSEGLPDFTTAAAAGELPTVEPRVTQASPETPADEKLPEELTGADLQPVAGVDPQGGAPREPIPRSQPEVVGTPPLQALPPAPASAAAPAVPAAPTAPAAPEGGNWWQRLTEGMRRTSSSLSEGVTGLFTKRRLDAGVLEELEDLLIQADLGIETATRISAAVGQGRYEKEIAPQEVRSILASEVAKALAPVATPLVVTGGAKPFVILMVGVNGAGKTTTIGKLAQKFRAQGLKTMLAAGDTFRAAAVEQLKVWGERTGSAVLSREQGADAAGLAYDALAAAKAEGADVLLVDTAGRLQNKAGLMAELEKIIRVMRKLDASAPHATLLVLDATVGQNAISQVELFRRTAGVTGLVMTKLDGTARGGILVALAAKFGLPVHFIGVGEGVEDLEPFEAGDFARAIAGLEGG